MILCNRLGSCLNVQGCVTSSKTRCNSLLRFITSLPFGGTRSIMQPSSNDGNPGKHVNITSDSTRIPVITTAVVTNISMESPTVKTFTLNIHNPEFNFHAGQWVDMFIPGIETVGGFSMYSSPHELVENKIIKLGIKVAKWPPTYWLHNQCKIGSNLTLQVGGDFYFNPSDCDDASDLLLLAGGVGVNPLASIYQYVAHLNTKQLKGQSNYKSGTVKLLYSTKSEDEILYKEIFDDISSNHQNMNVQYYITGMDSSHCRSSSQYITKDTLSTALDLLDISSLLVYICGPPPMIEAMNSHLIALGISEKCIKFEKWW